MAHNAVPVRSSTLSISCALLVALAVAVGAHASQPLADAECTMYDESCHADGQTIVAPILFEDHTGIDFDESRVYFHAEFHIPKIYEDYTISFDGTQDDEGTFDFDGSKQTTFWSVDSVADRCQHIVTARIPWTDFRDAYGELQEARDDDDDGGSGSGSFVRYIAMVHIDTGMSIGRSDVAHGGTEATPLPTGLPPSPAGAMQQLVQSANDSAHRRQITRNVTTRIPIEISLHAKSAVVDVARVTTATPWLTTSMSNERSQLNINPEFIDGAPFLTSRLVFETVVLVPGTALILANNVTSVNFSRSDSDDEFSPYFIVEEIVDLWHCDETHCAQFWSIRFEPKSCTFDGIFTLQFTGLCKPDDHASCVALDPEVATVVVGIAVDDLCGVTRVADTQASLALTSTACNTKLEGLVLMLASGVVISDAELLVVQVSAPSDGDDGNVITIYDNLVGPTSPDLNFTLAQSSGDDVPSSSCVQVAFDFLLNDAAALAIGCSTELDAIDIDVDVIARVELANGRVEDLAFRDSVTVFAEPNPNDEALDTPLEPHRASDGGGTLAHYHDMSEGTKITFLIGCAVIVSICCCLTCSICAACKIRSGRANAHYTLGTRATV